MLKNNLILNDDLKLKDNLTLKDNFILKDKTKFLVQYWGQRWLHLCNLCKPGIRLRQQSPPDPEHQDHLYANISYQTKF